MRFRREVAINVYPLLSGLFLFVSPWLFAYVSEAARLNLWISGAAIAAISIVAFVAFFDWEEWLNFAAGAWLILSPWVLGFTHTRAMHVCIGIGAVVAFVAALELWVSKFDPEYSPNRPARPGA